MSKRKTQDEYIKEVAECNPYVEVLAEYINANTKILHGCKKCGNTWMQKPSHILAGHGCQKCGIETRKIKSRFSNEIFLQKLNNKNKYIRPLEEYTGMNNKMNYECLIDGYKWNALPSSVLQGHGCPRCATTERYTTEIYTSKVHKINANIIILGEYTKSNERIKCQCKICNYIWNPIASSLLQGFGCPKCNKGMRTTKQYKNDLKIKNPTIICIDDFIDISTKILHKCLICSHEWYLLPNNALSKAKCPVCSKLNHYITYSNKFINMLNKKHIKCLSGYNGAQNPVSCECMNCGYIWNVKYANSLYYCGCPKCNSSFSKGEDYISEYLTNLNVDFKRQKKYNVLRGVGNLPLSYDFYLQLYNTLIEFQGRQHFYPIDHFGGYKTYIIQQIHDLRKRKYAKEHNINFLTIWYDEIDKVPKILNQYLNNLKLESVTTVIPSIAI